MAEENPMGECLKLLAEHITIHNTRIERLEKLMSTAIKTIGSLTAVIGRLEKSKGESI